VLMTEFEQQLQPHRLHRLSWRQHQRDPVQRWRASAYTQWSRGPWGLAANATFIGSYQTRVRMRTASIRASPRGSRWAAGKLCRRACELRIGVQNVFDARAVLEQGDGLHRRLGRPDARSARRLFYGRCGTRSIGRIARLAGGGPESKGPIARALVSWGDDGIEPISPAVAKSLNRYIFARSKRGPGQEWTTCVDHLMDPCTPQP